jgi:hypothetical protein
MQEFIGVKSYWDIATELTSPKREALMFNRIAVPDCRRLLKMLKWAKHPQQDLINELEWLIESGIIFIPEDTRIDESLLKNEVFRLFYELEQEYHRKVHQFREKRRNKGFPQIIDNDLQEVYLNEMSMSFCRVNRISLQLREFGSLDAYPLLPSIDHIIQSPTARKSCVVQIVIQALPLPDNSTSWEQIIEFRSDPNSKHKFLDLRNWMNEVARGALEPIEVEQKLEHLMSQYQRHMALHRMKTTAGILETVVVSTAEFLEDFVKFKWGKIAKGLFALKHRRIALMEGELTSPGSEVAYIIKSREQFS